MKPAAILRSIPWLGAKVDRLVLLASGLFDPGYYLARYPDVVADPLTHYLSHGASQLRDPSPHFRTRYYLAQNPDVARSGMNPLVHFVLFGAREGRDPNPFFDSSFYLESNEDVRSSGANPLAHFLIQGRQQGRDPAPRCAPRVHLYATCWNEVRLLEFFFRHYDNVVQRYVIFDEGSTDGSLDLLRGHPKVELRRFVRADPDSFVTSELSLFNNCWKESRGFRGSPTADWVIVCNIDEHLTHPDLGSYLAKCQAAGITAIPALGHQMLADDFPRPGEKLCETRTRALQDASDCKLILFSPTAIKEINFAPGGHLAQPEGNVVVPARDEVLLHNYQILGIDYTLARFAELKTGLGATDRARGWGFHYGWTREGLGRMYAALADRGVDTAAVANQRWKPYPRPDWWRPLPRKHVHPPPPLLSIVTTVYDRVACLDSCIRSVRDLNFQDYEHIIVADHPPRDIFARLQSLVAGANDARLALYDLPSRTNNWGISPAEFGMQRARGKYLSFLDDDNAFLPHHFDALIDRLESHPDTGVAYSSCLWNGERVLRASPPQFAETDLGQLVFRRDSLRACIQDKLNYSDYNWDWHLMSDLIEQGVRYEHIDQESFIFRLQQYPQLLSR